MTLVVASRKGGAGKTTLSAHLAVEAHRHSYSRVGLVDADPQGSLTAWWRARSAETPALIDASAGIASTVRSCRKAGYELLVVDTPPYVSERIQALMESANLVVIPTRPSPLDLRAVGGTRDLAVNAGKRMVFVVNSATPRARLTAESAIALSQHGVVAPVLMHMRQEYPASMIDGRTAYELNAGSKAAHEVSQLWVYIHELLQRKGS